jgi:hypothetical protein
MSTALSFHQFSAAFPKYSEKSLILFKVYQDLVLQNEYVNIEVIDGDEQYNCQSYVFKGISDNKIEAGKDGIFLPIDFDSELDLIW